MSVRLDIHVKDEDGMCLWDQEDWPCRTVQTANAAFELAAKAIEPTGSESMCCDEHAAGWQARTDSAEEIRELIRK
jgi:hypothetical protein